jgi:exodeoxyribonuclease-5
MKIITKTIHDYLHFQNPTSEQKKALTALADFVSEENSEDFLILCGAAGTGKTSITSALIGYLNASSTNYSIAAPTGRAARILGRKTNSVSATIHSKIYSVEPDKETGAVSFLLKKNASPDFTVFIIDEASMIASGCSTTKNNQLFHTDDSLLNHLAKFVKQGNRKNKIIFLGDKNQLPPIDEQESNALNPNYLRSNFGWTGGFHYLTEVKRQEDGSYILTNAIALRKAIDNESPVIPVINAYRHKNGFIAAREFAKQYNPSNSDITVSIGQSHKANKIFNDEVRKNIFSGQIKLVEPGDLMLVTQNWKRNGDILFNGDHVVIEEVHLDKIETVANLHFAPVKLKAKALDGTEQMIEDYILLDILLAEKPDIETTFENALRAERFRKNVLFRESGKPEDDRYVGAIRLMYGYAITCHKAQGGEWDKVYVNTFGVKDPKWSYTAVTRAKQVLEVY